MGPVKPAKYNQPHQSTETSFETEILFKKQQDSISHVYKELKILKFTDPLHLQNCQTIKDWQTLLMTKDTVVITIPI